MVPREGHLAFDGQDDRVYLGTESWGYYGEYSFEAWVNVRKYTNDDGQGSFIFGNERNDNGGIYVGLDSVGHIMTYHPIPGFACQSSIKYVDRYCLCTINSPNWTVCER